MEQLIKTLSEQGVLGLLLAISLFSNVYLFRLLVAEKDKRIIGAEKVRDDLVQPIGNIKESLQLIQTKIEISKEAQR